MFEKGNLVELFPLPVGDGVAHREEPPVEFLCCSLIVRSVHHHLLWSSFILCLFFCRLFYFLRASCCSSLWSSYLPPRSLYKGSRLATESTEIFKTDLKGLSSWSWQDAVHGYCLLRCTLESTPFHLCNESFDHRMWNVHCACSVANRFSLERSQRLCLSLALCDNRISRDVKCESPLRCKQTRSQLVAAHRLPCSEDLSSVRPAAKMPAAVEQRRPGCSAVFQPVGAGFKWPAGRLGHSSKQRCSSPVILSPFHSWAWWHTLAVCECGSKTCVNTHISRQGRK